MNRVPRATVFDLASRTWQRQRTPEDRRAEAERRRATLPMRRVHSAAGLSALDTPIQPPWAGPSSFTLQTLFDALRAAGVAPHGGYANASGLTAAEMDEAIAQLLVDALGTVSSSTTEEGVAPSHLLGMSEAKFPRVDPTDPAFQGADISQYGTYVEMVADLARMGAGRIRRAQQCDIYWASVFPYLGHQVAGNFYEFGDLVPPPADILTNLGRDAQGGTGTPDGYAALGWATGLIVACLCFGMKLDLTPFNAGGGATQNNGEGSSGGSSVPKDANNPGPAWSAVQASMPPWQAGLLVPSGLGWDPWYLPPGPTVYQQLVINVWPVSDEEARQVPRRVYTADERLCARRKCLGVLAFSTGIGEWLKKIDDALAAVGATIYDVVDVIDLCNETSGFFYKPPTPQTFTIASLDLLPASAREAGRYFALLAGPIRHRLAQMKFRTEVGSFGVIDNGAAGPRPDTFESELVWLENVLEVGIVEEVERWHALAHARLLKAMGHAVDPAADEWFTDETSAGFAWPPEISRLPAATDLLHQVGVHWFHDSNTSGRGVADPWGYADAVRMHRDVRKLRELAARLARRKGFDLDPVMMAITFPATDPGPDPKLGAVRYAGTSETLQAAVHVRNAATLLASGAAGVGIFNFAGGVVDAHNTFGAPPRFAAFPSFASDGLHNDVLYGPALSGSYSQAFDCWPRSVWFALRRLMWLHGQLRHVPQPQIYLLEATQGLVVIGFEFATALTLGPDGLPFSLGPWRHGYLIWLDQYADSALLHADPRGATTATLAFTDPSGALTDQAASLYELVSLVPELDHGGVFSTRSGGRAAEINGYGQLPAINWIWSGWNSALQGVQLAHDQLQFLIRKCDPTLKDRSRSALAPLCVLTNMIYAGSS